MRHYTHLRRLKRTLMLSLSIMLLFLLPSAILATDSMPKTEASTSFAQGALRQGFVLHLAPDADLEVVRRALHKLSATVGEIGQIESPSPFVLYIQATPDAVPELKRIPGVLQVTPLKSSESPSETLDAEMSSESSAPVLEEHDRTISSAKESQTAIRAYWLVLEPISESDRLLPLLLDELAALQAKGMVESFEPPIQDNNSLMVLAPSTSEGLLHQLPSVLDVASERSTVSAQTLQSGGGHITGTVTDSNGTPLPNIDVNVYQYNEEIDSWRLIADNDNDNDSDASGQYDVGGLNTGWYRVRFDDDQGQYATEYYNNAPDLESATNVAVRAGLTTTGIDASLEDAGHITGTVSDESGNPLADIRVSVSQYNEELDDWQWRYFHDTDSEGQYDVGSLNTGTYRLRFYDFEGQYATQYYDNALDIESATDIAVTVGQVTTGIDASLTLRGHITGTVSDESGNPLANIRVRVYQYHEQSDDWQELGSDYSDSEGQYDVGALNTGTYRVHFYDPQRQYATQYYDNALDIESATDIAVTAGQVTTEIDASLTLRGHITGTVSDESNNPLAGIQVRVYLYHEHSDHWQELGYDYSDSEGQYDVGGLNTGIYGVRFYDDEGNYLTEYYDNAPNIERATNVAVTAGQTTTGIDASLSLAGHITGTVSDLSNNPLANIRVRVYQYNEQSEEWQSPRFAHSDSEGQYDVGGLNTGSYRVHFYDNQEQYATEYYDNAPDIESATDIAVTAGQVTTGIDASLTLKGRITGTVSDESGNPLADIEVRVYEYYEEVDYWQPLGFDDTDSEGQYDVGGLNTGTYRVRFYDAQHQYATQYYDNALDIKSATDIAVTMGQLTTGIDASLALTGRITGTVTDESGNLLPNIYVRVYQYNEESDYWQVKGSDDTDSEGHYDIGRLNRGTYRVRFYDYQNNYLSEYYGNVLDIGSATNITVTGGQINTGIDATLALTGRITGTVTDADGNPLPTIQVAVYQYHENLTYFRLLGYDDTDSEGQYDVGRLNTGTYRVRFYDDQGQYVTQYNDNALDIESATDITVTVGQVTTGIDASLSLAGHITGTVTNAEGNLWQSISVNVYQYNEEFDDWQWLRSYGTDSEGQYDVSGLNTGSYRVGFGHDESSYLTEYYDNALDIESATDIAVTAGQTTTGIDASFEDAGHITGTVTDADGNPLPSIYAVVYQYNEQVDDWQWLRRGYTDSEGQYDVGRLNTGTYRVGFRDYEGSYLTQYYDNVLDIESATDIAVTAGQVTTGIDASLEDGGHITGTVTDAEGNLLRSIEVSVYQYNEQLDDWQRLRFDETDSEGQYDVGGLNTGTYRVRFPNYGRQYATEYYANSIDIESATDIAVTAGLTTTEIDASLRLKGHIIGTVSDESGNPLRGIDVNVYQYNEQEDNWQWTRSNYTNFDGQYRVDRLNPGTYRVHFLDWDNNYLSEYYDNAADLESATDVMVIHGQTTSDIDASLAIAGSLAGTVSASDGKGLRNIAVDVYRSDGNGGWQWAGWDYTNEIGNYVVTGLPAGTYRVGFFDWEGVYFTKYYGNATDLQSATDLVLTAGENRAGIDVTLEEGGHITGTVSHELFSVARVVAGTEPLSGIEVQAYRHQGGEWQWVRSATTDADGSYDIGGLASGSYRVGFFEPFGKYAYEYYHDSSNLAGATNISVTAGQSTPNIDAILTDAAEPLAQITSEGGVSVDPQTGQITITRSVRNGNASDVTISLSVTCPDGETASDVSLLVGKSSYLMSADGNQQYSATILAQDVVDGAQITVSNLCNGNREEQAIGQIQLFNPTGQITDAQTGEPVVGATIALVNVPGWQARTSRRQNSTPKTCESNLSKRYASWRWPQEAPTEFGVMPDPSLIGSVMTPLISDAEGYYGWDVVRGCWYVVVEAKGYEKLVSPVVGMPPKVTDLDLALTPSEPQVMQFRAVNYQINENHGTAQVTVIVTTPPTQTVTVDYSTSNNTATASEDYTTATGTLTFAPGETISAFNVPILDDEADEGNETINLTLSNPTNVALGERVQATLTIGEDDGETTSSDDTHEIYLPMIISTSE